jgi:predicted Ser/Thr protein kinase
MYNDSLFNAFARSFEARSETDMSMAEYLKSCRSEPMRYANAAELPKKNAGAGMSPSGGGMGGMDF